MAWDGVQCLLHHSNVHDLCTAHTQQHGYRPRTTEERMHLAALQHHRPPPVPGFYHPGMYMQRGRRSMLAKQKVRMCEEVFIIHFIAELVSQCISCVLGIEGK